MNSTSSVSDTSGRTPGHPAVQADRRTRIRAAQLNGIDGVEVDEDGITLTVTFLGKAPHGLCPSNVRIDGGRRITGLEAVEVCVEREEDPELDDRLLVTLDRTGDASRYRLSLVEEDPYGRPGTEPYPGFDVRYASGDFVFRPDCAPEADCAPAAEPCPTDFPGTPVVDYTARDYETIRQVLLDRLALTTPDWVERNPADLGTTLVEMLAYSGDLLSHHQDAVATEAYLDTARKRASVRRHVRLIDYAMHDGVNARTFVNIETVGEHTLEPGTFRFAAVDTRALEPTEAPEPGTVVDERDLSVLAEFGGVEVFEPVLTGDPLVLREAHNAIRLWTWGGEVRALPKGATSATLRDEWADEACEQRQLSLSPGDILVLEEVKGPRTGTLGDADPSHRQAVRITSVTEAVDAVEEQPVLEVTWAREDALTFPLCLATLGGPDCRPVEDVSVARGNTVLVDHGRTLGFATGRVPQWLDVPAEPAVLAPCAPPAFGCGDRDEGNAPARLLNALTRKTDSGRLLTPADVTELFTVVGREQTTRAGIGLELAGQRVERVVPDTAHGQTGALRTLLAQTVFPGIVPRFRPVVQREPVVQAVPYPEPAVVAASQSVRLAAIPARVEERLVELWRSARDGDGLGEEEIAEVVLLFGHDAVERHELRRHPKRALRELLHRSDELMASKRSRLEVLVARAEAGTVLTDNLPWEIAHSWGPAYAEGLEPTDPVLHGPAATALAQDPRRALPALRLVRPTPVAPGSEEGDGTEEPLEVWEPRRDLVGSGPRDRHLVGELGDEPAGPRLTLRFGDGRHGARPEPGSRLAVHHRIGGGRAGNVGAEAINHLVLVRPDDGSTCEEPPVAGVRNPLPATGGTEPEPVDQVRQLAPLDLRRTKLRAVTAADYAELTSALKGVQRAAAEIRWTGSGQEVHIAVDPLSGHGTGRRGLGQEPSPALLDSVRRAMEPYRRIGHELVVGAARLVPLDIALKVCAAPGHQHGQILAELHRVLGHRRLPGGKLGFFHPDALTFGEPVRLSRLVAVAAAVPGVVSVEVTKLQQLFHSADGEIEEGLLRLGPLEVATCHTDPDRPETGRLEIDLVSAGRHGNGPTTGQSQGHGGAR